MAYAAELREFDLRERVIGMALHVVSARHWADVHNTSYADENVDFAECALDSALDDLFLLNWKTR